jgi:type II secretion system protein H
MKMNPARPGWSSRFRVPPDKLKLELQRGNPGFTLIELIVVVTLIGIMTAMILPEMRGTYEDALLRSTSRELVNAFGLAHSRAVSFNQPHRVRLESVAGQYHVEKRVRDRGREEFVPLRDVPACDGKLDTRIAVEVRTPGEVSAAESSAPVGARDDLFVADLETIAFYPDGTADAKEVYLEDRQGFRLALRINPITARVRVVEFARQ